MLRYGLKRCLQIVPLLLLASLMAFLMLQLGSGDPAMAYLRLSSVPPTDQALAAVRSQLGLDRPLAVQYLDWLWRALHLDFGRSYVTGLPVMEELLYYLPNTLKLGALSLALTAAFSLPLGLWCALRRGSAGDRLVGTLSLLVLSVPPFLLGYMMIWLFSVKLRWLPPMGLGGFSSAVMPALTLSAAGLCAHIRLVRGAALEQLHCRWALYCRLRGLSEGVLVGRHVLGHVTVPLATSLAMELGGLLGGAVVVENLFAWPGLGRFALEALYNRDYPAMQCFLLTMTALFAGLNLAVDLFCACWDPRIRLAHNRAGRRGP